MERWNSMLCGHTVRGMFITALLGRLVPSTGGVELCSAGHCHPFLTGIGGGATEIKIAGSPPLGLLPKLSASLHRLTLNADQWLILYTDGLVESFNAAREPLDSQGVEQILCKRFADSAAVLDALDQGEKFHRKEADPHDDLTILILGLR